MQIIANQRSESELFTMQLLFMLVLLFQYFFIEIAEQRTQNVP